MDGKLTKNDVWGTFDPITMARISKGMVVARGLPKVDGHYFTKEEHARSALEMPDICPVWGDKLPYKSVTIVCNRGQVEEVVNWLEYVQGADSIRRVSLLKNGTTAIRSDYMCW